MFIPSSNNAISVFFQVVTERRGQRGGVGAQCNMCLFFSRLMRREPLPSCVARSPAAAAKVGKQMFALRFNQILASPSPRATWCKDFNFFSDLYNTLTSQENHTYLRPPLPTHTTSIYDVCYNHRCIGLPLFARNDHSNALICLRVSWFWEVALILRT